MGFAPLLGNDSLKDHLRSALSRGRASHFYLISGPEGAGKGLLAKLLSAALQCEAADRPCLQCPACRKVMSRVHPDVIWVTDGEHKNVAVKIIRRIREEMYIRPNEGNKKIYILPQTLGIEGQNALLKVLEEPPAYGVFLLLTDNPESVLPTVRSRCVQLRLQSISRDILEPALTQAFPKASPEAVESAIVRSAGYFGQARKLLADAEKPTPQTQDFVKALTSHDILLMTRTLAQMERLNREQLTGILEQWMQLLEAAMACRAGMPAENEYVKQVAAAISARELNARVDALRLAIEYTGSNVSPGAVCGYLMHRL